jgi:hypothetical protein
VDASVETDSFILDSFNTHNGGHSSLNGLNSLNIVDSGCGSSVGSSVESNGDLLELYQDFRVRLINHRRYWGG